MSNPVLENIHTRRVVRDMTDEPVDPEALAQILEAGRWSPTGGNQRPNRFVVHHRPAPATPHPPRLARHVPAPARPHPRLRRLPRLHRQLDTQKDSVFLVDVGKAAQTMALAAHSLGPIDRPRHQFQQSGGP